MVVMKMICVCWFLKIQRGVLSFLQHLTDRPKLKRHTFFSIGTLLIRSWNMSASQAQRPTRNKPSLRHEKEDTITMNAIADNKKRRTTSAGSTPRPSAQKSPSEPHVGRRKKPASHTKAKVTAALSIIPLYTYQTNNRNTAREAATSSHRAFKLRRFQCWGPAFGRICTNEGQGSASSVSVTVPASLTTRPSTCDDVHHQQQATGRSKASYR